MPTTPKLLREADSTPAESPRPLGKPESRRLALALGFLGLAGTIVGGITIANRIAAFQKSEGRKTWVFQPLDQRDFKFADQPVTISDVEDAAADQDRRFVLVRYGSAEQRLAVVIPSKYKLPGLASYGDWMRVLRFAESTGMSEKQTVDKIAAGGIRDRLAIVTRTPQPGTDPDSWGEVWRKEWKFDFYELIPPASTLSPEEALRIGAGPEPTFRHERLGFPTTRAGQAEKPGEIHEGTWQFNAALFTMPRNRPNPQFRYSAYRALSWILPATGISALVGILGFGFAFAPRRR